MEPNMKRTAKIKTVATKTDRGTYRFIGSTAAVDRMGEVVEQNWNLENFKANPVVLYAHNQYELPVGRALSTEVVEGRLEFEVEFVPREVYPFAGIVSDLVEKGFLNAVSVGFIPVDMDANIIKKSELLELSIVPVPANYEALIQRGTKKILPVFKDWDSTPVVTKMLDRPAYDKFFAAVKSVVESESKMEDAPPASLEALEGLIAQAIEAHNADDGEAVASSLMAAGEMVRAMIDAEDAPPSEDETPPPPEEDAKSYATSVLLSVTKQLTDIESALADPDTVSRILKSLGTPKKKES